MAKDFKAFIRLSGMTHVRTSPYYPQSNGKIESWHKTIKRECIRPETPLCLGDARRIAARYVTEYNTVRLHSGIGPWLSNRYGVNWSVGGPAQVRVQCGGRCIS